MKDRREWVTDKDTEDRLNGVRKEAAHFPIEESEADSV